jgi:tetratricopeptide (TPR) repeat protein
MQIPRPDLSINLGVPNACTRCHQDQSNQWAFEALLEWDQLRRDAHTERATAFAKADDGHASAQPTLAAIARDTSQPAIWRASALSRMALNSDSLTQLLVHLRDTDPMIRAEAARRSAELPRDWRQQHLIELASDPDLHVRLTVANSLADFGKVGTTDGETEQLVKLDSEYRAIAERHMDQVETLAQLGEYEAKQGNLARALKLYTRAISQNPQLVGAYINKADLQYRTANNAGAIETLRAGLTELTGNPDLSFSLGLAFAREGLREEALKFLRDGAMADNAHYQFVYAVALHDYGQHVLAIEQLQALIARWPEDEQAHSTLVSYLANSGRIKEAADVAATMARTWPQNRQYAHWARQLRGARP